MLNAQFSMIGRHHIRRGAPQVRLEYDPYLKSDAGYPFRNSQISMREGSSDRQPWQMHVNQPISDYLGSELSGSINRG